MEGRITSGQSTSPCRDLTGLLPNRAQHHRPRDSGVGALMQMDVNEMAVKVLKDDTSMMHENH